MIGQGRPNTESAIRGARRLPSPDRRTTLRRRCASRSRYARAGGLVVALRRGNRAFALSLLAAALVLLAAVPSAAAEVSLRLRMEWGGAGEHAWHGSVFPPAGTISDVVPLGIEADEPGSMWVAARALEIHARSGRLYDGVDFTLTAPADSTFDVSLTGREGAVNLQVPVSKLLQDAYSAALDSAGNRLLIRRAPGDRLRVKLARDSVIFSPGEVAEVEVQPHLLPAAFGNRALLLAQLFPARTIRDLQWSAEHEVSLDATGTAAEAAILAVKMPDVEGVYDLRIAVQGRALQNRLGLKQTSEERRIQVVVVGEQRPARAASVPWPTAAETLLEFDPAGPKWWDRLPNMPMMPGMRRGPLGHGDATARQHPLGALTQLGPGGREPNVSWEAFPLPVARPGQPHVVEIEYPTDVAQTLGVSIVEPNTAGKVTPIGIDSGIYVADDAATAEPKMARHRLTFWPRTKTPLLLLTNQRDGAPAVFGKVRVIGPKASVVPNFGLESNRPTFLPPAFSSEPPVGGRLLLGYYDRPLFPENFSASEAFDDWSGRGLDDWVTFYEGATRLVEYLQHVGYNGMMMTVVADGSSIYPSRLLEPTPRYDTGAFFATGQDPYRKDVLELLFRLFDREGLRLVPTLQFAAPLAEVETLKRRAPRETSGCELVDERGQPWSATHEARQGLAPYYNPLDSRVQDAMVSVVRELCERYRQHASFAGLGVQLSADGYAQLPGAEWGYDETTLSRFVREANVAALTSESHAARLKLIATEYRPAWLEWRTAAMAKLHRRMLGELARTRGESAPLYLAGAHLFERSDLEQLIRPTLRARPNVDALLISLGIDPRQYQGDDAIVLMRPQWIEPARTLSEQGAGMELGHSAELDHALHARGASAALFFHEPQQLHLPTFDAKSPFKGTQMLIVGQPSPAGALNRQRFVHALATLDAGAMFDGGWLLPLGEEEALADFVTAYRQLPAAPFETIPGCPQPVTVRRHTDPQGTHVYVTNDSPWKVRFAIDIDMPAGAEFTSLSGTHRLPPLRPTGALQTWTVDLEPFDLIAVRFSAEDVKLESPQVSFGEDVDNLLYARIRELGERVAVLQQPERLKLLANPGFEEPPQAAAAVPGWELHEQVGASVTLDAQEKSSGSYSAHFASTQAAASFVSDPIAAMKSGHLTVGVRLRVSDDNRQPPLRLAISGRWRGQDYYRYVAVGAGTDQALTAKWKQFVVQVRDLPTDDLTDLRMRFDLTAPGEVWIDDVALREFDDEEIRALQKMILAAGYMLENRQFGDCLRLLDGYWPRFLKANVPYVPGPVAMRPRHVPKKDESVPAATDADKPGLMERMRRAMPFVR